MVLRPADNTCISCRCIQRLLAFVLLGAWFTEAISFDDIRQRVTNVWYKARWRKALNNSNNIALKMKLSYITVGFIGNRTHALKVRT
jgi:hypothetical protein